MRAFNGEVHYGTIAAGPAPRCRAGPTRRSSGSARTRSLEGRLAAADRAGGAGHRRPRRLLPGLHGRPDADVLARAPARPICARRYDTAREIMRRSRPRPGPGVARREPLRLSARARRRPPRACFAGAWRISFVGHGFGLEIDEPPFLARGYDQPLEEGMVFALEPKFVYAGEGAVGIENSYAVTADGVERLTTAPEELIEL